MSVERAAGNPRAERVFYAVTALLSTAAIVYAWRQPWAHIRTGDGLSMAAFPTVFAGALLVAAVAAAARGARGHQPAPAAEEAPALVRSGILLGGGSVLSGLGLWYFDPVLSSALLVLVLMLAGRVRDWRVLAAITAGTGLVVYLLFILALGVYFPQGWLQ